MQRKDVNKDIIPKQDHEEVKDDFFWRPRIQLKLNDSFELRSEYRFNDHFFKRADTSKNKDDSSFNINLEYKFF